LNGVGIVAALAAEARALGPLSFESRRPAVLAADIQLRVCGIGLGAAEEAARALIDAGVAALASWGMAGGLDPALGAGAIFLPSAVISAAGAELPTTAAWRERLGAALATHEPKTWGRLLSQSQPLMTVADKAAAFRATGALAVDMESLAVARIAAAHAIPFIAVRVIVDTAHDRLPNAAMIATRSGPVRIWRLIDALARAPAEVGPLIRLGWRYRAARRSLRAVAHAGSLARFAFPDLFKPSIA
jgi:adenosylhomocysteine nucleosidase